MSFLKNLFSSQKNVSGNIEETKLDFICDEDIDTLEVIETKEIKIETTQEELIAYGIIIGLISTKLDVSRVTMRDRASYCGILLDDNNRKPLARLYLDTNTMYIGTFDLNRKEVKHEIVSVNDIVKLKRDLFSVLDFYNEK